MKLGQERKPESRKGHAGAKDSWLYMPFPSKNQEDKVVRRLPAGLNLSITAWFFPVNKTDEHMAFKARGLN